jgi:hypothetical protein
MKLHTIAELCTLSLLIFGVVYLLIPITTTPPESQLRTEFMCIKEEFSRYAEDGNWPPKSLAETMQAWEQHIDPNDTHHRHPNDCRWLKSGKDPWGSSFVYDVDTTSRVVTIRSIGRNRTDEDGAGDDVQRKYDLASGALPLIQK